MLEVEGRRSLIALCFIIAIFVDSVLEHGLLFNYLIYFLAAIGALALLLSVTVGIAYWLVMRRLSASLRRTVAELESGMADSLELLLSQKSEEPPAAFVPPMRIHLESETQWQPNDNLTPRIDTWLRNHSFGLVDNYLIEELGGERLRVFVSDDRLLMAAIRFSVEVDEPYVEFCFDLGAGRRGGVCNPPDGTLPLPADAVGSYHAGSLSKDFALLSKMWLEAKELIEGHSVVPLDIDRIPDFFEEAHAGEMDFRLAQGGVSEAEIRTALAVQAIEPSEEEVAEIQEAWQSAIEQHLLDFSSRAQNHYYAGGKILIVHNGSVRSYLLNRILDMLHEVAWNEGAEREELLSTVAELRVLLNRFSPREAMLRPLLPPAVRYNLVDQLKQPVEADLYLLQPGS